MFVIENMTDLFIYYIMWSCNGSFDIQRHNVEGFKSEEKDILKTISIKPEGCNQRKNSDPKLYECSCKIIIL